MSVVRINISLSKGTFEELAREIEPRKRSRYISEVVAKFLKERRSQRLASEYRDAAEESKTINQDLEGTLGDGIH